MTSGYRQPFYFLSSTGIFPAEELHGISNAQIHPETAEKYGIKDGDWIWIESPRAAFGKKPACSRAY
jgi:anaerobic selenocysteine-containing dehydrogenase